jgi:hypothetical protein
MMGVGLAGFRAMMMGVMAVTRRGVGVVRGAFVIFAFIMTGGFAMMMRGLFVMGGGVVVMLACRVLVRHGFSFLECLAKSGAGTETPHPVRKGNVSGARVAEKVIRRQSCTLHRTATMRSEKWVSVGAG